MLIFNKLLSVVYFYSSNEKNPNTTESTTLLEKRVHWGFIYEA